MAEDRYNPKGAHGGDTGKTNQKGKGPHAEKGDQRREHSARSGSDSNEKQQQSGRARHMPGASSRLPSTRLLR